MSKNSLAEKYKRIMQEGGYKILDKSVFKFSNHAAKFLDGITTNEILKSTNACLDRLGKLIALADQKVIGDEVYIVIEKKFESKFLQHINSFIKFSKTKFEKPDLNAVHIINGSNNKISDMLPTLEKNNNILIKKNIGFIALLKNDELSLLENLNEIPDDIYVIIRIENNIPAQGIDFDNVMFLETGLYDAVSFTKGCYLGQEIIARVHYKGKPARKLVRILYNKFPDDNNVRINGEIAGKITSKCFSPKYNKHLAFAMIKDYDKEVDNGEILK